MQTQEFTLPNGGTPAAGQPDTGIFQLSFEFSDGDVRTADV